MTAKLLVHSMARRRSARVLGSLLLALFFLGVGGAAGYWAATRGPLTNTSPSASSEATDADSEQLYTCGMHPNVIQKGPGECPICHMTLTPLRAAGQSGEMAGGSKTIWIDPTTVQNMGVRTTAAQRGPLVKTIRTVGRVDYNEQTVYFINTKFEGWIERLNVDQTGVQVEKGQPLFDVYSPKLYAAQEEFFAALRGVERLNENSMSEARGQATELVEAARLQLEFFDVSDDQIQQLAQSRKIQKTLTIHSPARGIVTEKVALEGMYLVPGMRLYTIADLSKVWVYVDIYEYQLPWVRIGQEARMTLPYIPNREFVGHVTYVYPYLDQQTRVIKVRLEFDNPSLELKPAMFANVTLRADLDRNALLIPREAYIDSGTRKVAFLDLGGGRFLPRDIETGVEAEEGMVEVQAGLSDGDHVVVSGQFLLDAESKLKEAIAKMLTTESVVAKGKPALSPTTSPSDAVVSHAEPEQGPFACPMHHEQTSETRGACPICGMRMIPVASLPKPEDAPAAVAAQMNYIVEHYLELQKRFAADSNKDVALHALGLVSATDEILRLAATGDAMLSADFVEAARALRAAALKTNGKSLDADRVTFVELSGAVLRMIDRVRPSATLFPKLFQFHCPMTKGDWVQTNDEIANPFYGYAMLKCGEQTGVR